jgi:hypothetical protein
VDQGFLALRFQVYCFAVRLASRTRPGESEVGWLLGLIEGEIRVHVWQGDVAAAQAGFEG